MSHIQTLMQIGKIQIKSALTSDRMPEENKAATQFGSHMYIKNDSLLFYFFDVNVNINDDVIKMHQSPLHLMSDMKHDIQENTN